MATEGALLSDATDMEVDVLETTSISPDQAVNQATGHDHHRPRGARGERHEGGGTRRGGRCRGGRRRGLGGRQEGRRPRPPPREAAAKAAAAEPRPQGAGGGRRGRGRRRRRGRGRRRGQEGRGRAAEEAAEIAAAEAAAGGAEAAAKAAAEAAAKAAREAVDPTAITPSAEFEGVCVGFFAASDALDAPKVMAVCPKMDGKCPAVFHSGCTALQPVSDNVGAAKRMKF